VNGLLVVLLVACLNSALGWSDDFYHERFMGDFEMDGYDAYGYDGSLYSEFDPYEYYWNAADIQTEPPVELSSEEELTDYLAYDPTQSVVLGFFDPNTDESKENLRVFLEVANQFYMGVRFAYTTNEELRKSHEHEKTAIFVYPATTHLNEKYEKTHYRYPSTTVIDSSLALFIASNGLSLVEELNWANYELYDKAQTPHFVLYTNIDHEKHEKQFKYFMTRIRKIAQEFRGEMLFSVADQKEMGYLWDLDFSKLSEKMSSSNPLDFMITIVDKDKKFSMPLKDKKFDPDAVKQWIFEFLENKLDGETREVYRPQEMDSRDKEYGWRYVTRAHTHNFRRVAFHHDHTHVTLAHFYVPFDPHCQHSRSVLERVAENFHKDGQVSVISMDITRYFPTKWPNGTDIFTFEEDEELPKYYYIMNKIKGRDRKPGDMNFDVEEEYEIKAYEGQCTFGELSRNIYLMKKRWDPDFIPPKDYSKEPQERDPEEEERQRRRMREEEEEMQLDPEERMKRRQEREEEERQRRFEENERKVTEETMEAARLRRRAWLAEETFGSEQAEQEVQEEEEEEEGDGRDEL
jgi:thiol-disulfide isomerase/thioredoxin